MSGIATAVVGSAVIGGVVSNNASKRAANAAQQSSDDSIAFMQAAEDRARADINKLFPQATARRSQGYQQSLDLYSQALPNVMGAIQEGNMNAQQTISQSMPQIQNAILGGNIDYGFAQPKQQSIDLSSLLGGLPQLYQEPIAENPNGAVVGPQRSGSAASVAQNAARAVGKAATGRGHITPFMQMK